MDGCGDELFHGPFLPLPCHGERGEDDPQQHHYDHEEPGDDEDRAGKRWVVPRLLQHLYAGDSIKVTEGKLPLQIFHGEIGAVAQKITDSHRGGEIIAPVGDNLNGHLLPPDRIPPHPGGHNYPYLDPVAVNQLHQLFVALCPIFNLKIRTFTKPSKIIGCNGRRFGLIDSHTQIVEVKGDDISEGNQKEQGHADSQPQGSWVPQDVDKLLGNHRPQAHSYRSIRVRKRFSIVGVTSSIRNSSMLCFRQNLGRKPAILRWSLPKTWMAEP
ncbi:hypothetical protein ES703_116521 [subsurface metagenome]